MGNLCTPQQLALPKLRASSSTHRVMSTRLMTKALLILISFFAFLPFTAQSSEHNFSVTAGAYLSQGNYGSEDPIDFEDLPDTQVKALPFSLKYKTSDWSISLHSAFVSVDGNQTRLFVDEEFELQSETDANDRSGFSDISLKASYKFTKLLESTSFRLGTKVKLPTSKKEDKLGSGEIDYSLFYNTATRHKRNIYFTHGGYQISGDRDETNYNNRWFARLAWQRIITKHWLIGSSYYFKQASTNTRPPIRKLGLSATWLPKKNISYSLFSGLGFSDSTADWSMGIQGTFKF